MSFSPSLGLDYQSAQGFIKVGGQTYFNDQASLFSSSITPVGTFSFPVGGKSFSTFTVTFPAPFAKISGETFDGKFFTLTVPQGKLVLTFDYFPAANGVPAFYYFSQGRYVTTPEPETFYLMTTGLVSIVGLFKIKMRASQSQ